MLESGMKTPEKDKISLVNCNIYGYLKITIWKVER